MPFFRRRQSQGEDFRSSEPVLPSDVRYRLQYRQGLLEPRHIEALFRNRLQHLGFYLAMKATQDDDDIQTGLLRRAAANGYETSRLTVADARGALDYLASQDQPQVEAKKLNMITKQNLSDWRAAFGDVLTPTLEEHPDSTLFMVASAPYSGLEVLAAHSLLKSRPMGILKPNRLHQTEQPVGFMLDPTEDGVDISMLSHDFERPEAVIFDDMKQDGVTQNAVMNFWGAAERPAQFVTAMVVQYKPGPVP